jgi:K+-sensing histidine kinase KdpD
VIFEAFDLVVKNYPSLKMDFQISEETEDYAFLTVPGVAALLNIVFINLLKNAAVYSDNAQAEILITENQKQLTVQISSEGPTILPEDQPKLFEAFMRGKNSQNISGSGLGLRIVKRILEYHNAEISYMSPKENLNFFVVIFTK